METTDEKKHGLMLVKNLPENTKPKLSASDKAQLVRAMAQVCTVQNQYGKSQDELETLVEGLAWILASCTLQEIMGGLAEYVRTKSGIPTPSEILAIIDPPKKPFQPDWAVYTRLNKLVHDSGPYAINQDEIDYIAACERFSVEKMKNSSNA